MNTVSLCRVNKVWAVGSEWSQVEEWALRSPAANVNRHTMMLLRARKSNEVGLFTGATYRLGAGAVNSD